LASCDSSVKDAFRRSLGLVEEEARNRLGHQYANSRDNFWGIWARFCAQHALDPYLPTVPNRIPFLCVFAQRYRDGTLAANSHPVRSKQVQEAVRSVASGFTQLGLLDPRFNCFGHIDVRLANLYKGYTKHDPPPRRVKPVPISLLHEVARIALIAGDALSLATSDMAYIAFFYLLRPGEYCLAAESAPFRICDVQLFIGAVRLDTLTCPLATFERATAAQLEFTTQKNMIRGEVLKHGRSGHSIACPVASVIRRLTHLRSHGAPSIAPLYQVHTATGCARITSSLITAAIRVAAASTSFGFCPQDVNARALRAGGAMALLCANIDPNIIKMVGRWRSDAMFRYLHLSAFPLMRTLAPLMLQAGSFTLPPGQDLPVNAAALLDTVPEEDTAIIDDFD
jgi:hypothetical protein